jgi:hypothetical protein
MSVPGKRRTVAVDFHGVAHRSSKGWLDGTVFDPPVEGAGGTGPYRRTGGAVHELATLHRMP